MSALIVAATYTEAALAADNLGLEDWYVPHERTGDVHAHVPGVDTIVWVDGWTASEHPVLEVLVAVEAARQHGADLEMEYAWPGQARAAWRAHQRLAELQKRIQATGVPPEAADAPSARTRRPWWRKLLDWLS